MTAANYTLAAVDGGHHHNHHLVHHQKAGGGGGGGAAYEVVREVARRNAVVVFSMSGCCMCTVAKRLLFGLGVGPTIVELDHLPAGAPDIQTVLFHLQAAESESSESGSSSSSPVVPAVFVGGKLLGGIETLMACHINGSLVPLLKDAGALWL